MVCEVLYVSRSQRKRQVSKNNNYGFLAIFLNYDNALTTAKWEQDINDINVTAEAAGGINEIL